jgi:hypothetical protein
MRLETPAAGDCSSENHSAAKSTAAIAVPVVSTPWSARPLRTASRLDLRRGNVRLAGLTTIRGVGIRNAAEMADNRPDPPKTCRKLHKTNELLK